MTLIYKLKANVSGLFIFRTFTWHSLKLYHRFNSIKLLPCFVFSIEINGVESSSDCKTTLSIHLVAHSKAEVLSQILSLKILLFCLLEIYMLPSYCFRHNQKELFIHIIMLKKSLRCLSFHKLWHLYNPCPFFNRIP